MRRHTRLLAASLVVSSLAFAACGDDEEAASAVGPVTVFAAASLTAAFTEIGFEQDVVFYDTHSPANGPSVPTGRVVKTHWRRGHFRRQRHGKGLNQTKLVFIRPCLVNAELFKGDLAETVVALVAGLVGVIALSAALQGWLLTRVSLLTRGVLAVAGLSLLWPGLASDALGLLLLAIVVLGQVRNRARNSVGVASQ